MNKQKYGILVGGVFYAVIRYGLVKGEPLANWPAYITNKALAFTAVGWLVLGIWAKGRNIGVARELFRDSILIAAAHGFISAALLSPGYFEYLMGVGGRLNAFGEMMLLAGGLALGTFVWMAVRGGAPRKIHMLGLLAIMLFHIASVGALKWIDASRWTYGLVPISLISACIVVAGVVMLLRQRDVE